MPISFDVEELGLLGRLIELVAAIYQFDLVIINANFDVACIDSAFGFHMLTGCEVKKTEQVLCPGDGIHAQEHLRVFVIVGRFHPGHLLDFENRIKDWSVLTLLIVIADVGASGLSVSKAWIINAAFRLMINLVSAAQSVHADPLGLGHSLVLPRRLLRAVVDGD